jgi:hypothetical protein
VIRSRAKGHLLPTYLVTGCSYKVDSRDDYKYRQLHPLQLSLESHTFVIVITHRASESLLTQTRPTIDYGRLLALFPEINLLC